MKVGLPISEVPMFQAYVRETLNTVDQICAQARQRPELLPSPSRKAYAYLKQLDLDQIPLSPATGQAPKLLRLSNIRAQERAIQSAIVQAAQSFPVSRQRYRNLASKISARVQSIESLCHKSGLTPAHLTGRANPYYRWLRFLQEDRYLKLHLAATYQVKQTIARRARACQKDGTPIVQGSAEVIVIFVNMSGLFRYRQGANGSQFEINEGYIAGDLGVLTALAQVFISGKQAPAMTKLRQFSLHEAFSEILLAIELTVEDIRDTAKGQYFNLNKIYETVYQRYLTDLGVTGQSLAAQNLKTAIGRPKLAWSVTQTRRKFGHYEPSNDRIVLSQTLDSPDIPSYVVEFVMYHELLHRFHGETWVNGQLRMHTPAFRQDERLFQQYQLAQDVLQTLASHR